MIEAEVLALGVASQGCLRLTQSHSPDSEAVPDHIRSRDAHLLTNEQ